MKNINAIILLSSLTSASVFAGAYVENREAYNLASDQGEVMLRVGYNFDMGAGIMLTNTYTFQREDELKHGYCRFNWSTQQLCENMGLRRFFE
ncbi:oligogalacturonate-specific porin KdgM family protein [Escherichia coli]|uniref:oligogalacturonate-specific porin KdgM family protein n=1 Tax=Escherichia coli TaxID=562 RepID=UPI000AF1B7BA|nr:oligogalacturonate-specific porin KdgM family protein [Escherichia coli]MBY2956934.1 hypothetical protein [Escherichia coli]STF63530.1 outer membrane porin L [Escherichia coli]